MNDPSSQTASNRFKQIKAIESILACPHCGHPLNFADGHYECGPCRLDYHFNDQGQLDLRLKKPKRVTLEFELGTSGLLPTHLQFEPVSQVAPTQIQYPKAEGKGRLVLDLGCGGASDRDHCESMGYHYIGLDFSSPQALILGDGHALPLKSDSFDFLISYSVLEHIRYPFIMIQEAFRILKPGAAFIGSVAFLEPYHAESYYHFTHLGTLNMMKYAGFKVNYIGPKRDWNVLHAQAIMGLFPNFPYGISKIFVKILNFASRLWCAFGNKFRTMFEENFRLLRTAGGIFFSVEK